jgi:transcriptional regulator with XRE-family HTH domain
MAIGDRIKSARSAAGLTQEALSRRTELSLQAVGDIERGVVTDPHISSLRQIADALGVPIRELLEEPEAAPAGSSLKGQAPSEGAGPHTLEELLKQAGIPGPYWLTQPIEEFESFWRGVSFEEARDRFSQIRREYQALKEELDRQMRGEPSGAPELQEHMVDICQEALGRHFYALAAAPGKEESKGAFHAREQHGDTRPLRAVELASGASGVVAEGLAG